MLFIEKCEELIKSYQTDCIIRNNGAMLLHTEGRLKARYVFYKGLKEEYINCYLIAAYKRNLPKEYIELLKRFNGADLFSIKVLAGKGITFEYGRLHLFGLPLSAPGNRKADEEEPFDIRTQDQIERHKKIPNSWLKIGCYNKELGKDIIHDIFLDTEDGRTYTCEKNKYQIDNIWNGLDVCLCDLYDHLSTTEWELKL